MAAGGQSVCAARESLQRLKCDRNHDEGFSALRAAAMDEKTNGRLFKYL